VTTEIWFLPILVCKDRFYSTHAFVCIFAYLQRIGVVFPHVPWCSPCRLLVKEEKKPPSLTPLVSHLCNRNFPAEPDSPVHPQPESVRFFSSAASGSKPSCSKAWLLGLAEKNRTEPPPQRLNGATLRARKKQPECVKNGRSQNACRRTRERVVSGGAAPTHQLRPFVESRMLSRG